jgi:L-fucose mutarotase
MLKNIDPILNADLLFILAAMGHGDELAIVDANFPAASTARRLVRLDGVNATRALEAVLALLPLDDFVDSPLTVMEVVGDPDSVPESVNEFRAAARNAEGKDIQLTRIERFEFYERAKGAFAVLSTGETRLYGCVLVRKGIIRPAGLVTKTREV